MDSPLPVLCADLQGAPSQARRRRPLVHVHARLRGGGSGEGPFAAERSRGAAASPIHRNVQGMGCCLAAEAGKWGELGSGRGEAEAGPRALPYRERGGMPIE